MWRDLAVRLVYTSNTLRYAVEGPRILEALSAVPRMELLIDAGAGSGPYIRTVYAGRSRRVLAVEPDERIFSILRKRLAERPDAWQGVRASICDMPFPGGIADGIACTQVLEHIQDDAAAVAEFARVLKPGGHVLFTVPLAPAPWHDPYHVREGYTLDGLTRLLAAKGFVRLSEDYFLTSHTQRATEIVRRVFRGYAPRLFPLAELRLSRQERKSSRPYGLLALFRKTR